MASQLNPYINFRGNARQALEFYQGALGGELRLTTFGQFDPEAGDNAEQIMHGQLETPKGYTIMASDTPDSMPLSPGDNITVSISGADEDLRGYWDKLSAGGTVFMPLEKQGWGDEFGMFADQFGVRWMINITQN